APTLTGVNLSAGRINEGDVITLAGKFTDPGAADTHVVVIDWGDGVIIKGPAGPGHTFAASHVYADNGVYAVRLRVTDDDGGSDGGGPFMVAVNNVAPVLRSFTNSSPGAGGAVEGQAVSALALFNDKG